MKPEKSGGSITSRAKREVDVSVPIPPDVGEEILAVAHGNPKYVFWNHTGGQPASAATNWCADLRPAFVEAGFPEGIRINYGTRRPSTS